MIFDENDPATWPSIKGWEPPEHWEYGVCKSCRETFIPKRPKQFWCSKCREKPMRHWEEELNRASKQKPPRRQGR